MMHGNMLKSINVGTADVLEKFFWLRVRQNNFPSLKSAACNPHDSHRGVAHSNFAFAFRHGRGSGLKTFD